MITIINGYIEGYILLKTKRHSLNLINSWLPGHDCLITATTFFNLNKSNQNISAVNLCGACTFEMNNVFVFLYMINAGRFFFLANAGC